CGRLSFSAYLCGMRAFPCFFIVSSTILFTFFCSDPAPSDLYTLSLHDALPISSGGLAAHVDHELALLTAAGQEVAEAVSRASSRSEEHTSELQSRFDLVCRLLLEKKKNHHQVDKYVTE